MKVIGIIAEYNPFHLGHLYQINKIKEMYPNSIIIAIISTNFTERGEISILSKWDKTKICLEYGIDLVVELPTLYATQAADIFAYAAINILNGLHIDTLVFGTESDNINDLIKLANIQLNDKKYDELVKKYLDTGINYPTAQSKALKDITNINIDKPNDLLALSYIKEIIKNNYNITPISIKRTNDYHSKIVESNIVNASLIRKMIVENKDISKYVPNLTLKYINKDISIDNAYKYLLYMIINNKEHLNEYLSVDEGIENRLTKQISNSNTWEELVMNIKTKRYTYNKINRMLIHLLLGIKKTNNIKDIYIRILGFNTKGRNYLNKIKKNITVPIFTSYKPNKVNSLDIEYKSTYIYSLITNNLSLIKKEYQNKPIIKKWRNRLIFLLYLLKYQQILDQEKYWHTHTSYSYLN